MSWGKSYVTLVPRCECGYEFELVLDESGKSKVPTIFKCPYCGGKTRKVLPPTLSQGRGVTLIVRNDKCVREKEPEFYKNAKFVTMTPKCSCGFTFKTIGEGDTKISFVLNRCPACKRTVKKVIIPRIEATMQFFEIRN